MQTELRGKIYQEEKKKIFETIDCSLLTAKGHSLLTGFPPNLVWQKRFVLIMKHLVLTEVQKV